ncbi:dimethylsulfonioproprionate lyase family protein [Sedimentitalea sp.]|uniref:dimethylsulfonioproprionate lyase family protein n=1 Tax=Sedimentitalea sp. TaxID=2048915 RepID=UPI003296FB51
MTHIPSEATLKSAPDWTYLLREFYEMYRFLPSGGSTVIRSHQRTVRAAISRLIRLNSQVILQPPATKPVTAHLRRSLDAGCRDRLAAAVQSLQVVVPLLSWQYGYEKVPRGLAANYAYAELCGPAGPVISEDLILGVVLFGPGCTYPAHAHKGITESYICLSGAVSENNQGVYAAGSLIFNPPEHLHRITVGDREPALLAYAWTGNKEDLADQKMVFTRRKS